MKRVDGRADRDLPVPRLLAMPCLTTHAASLRLPGGRKAIPLRESSDRVAVRVAHRAPLRRAAGAGVGGRGLPRRLHPRASQLRKRDSDVAEGPSAPACRNAPELSSALVVWRRLLRKRWLKKGKTMPPWVFPSLDGTALEERNVRHVFTRMLEKAELRKIRIHDLRHSYASLLLQAGAPDHLRGPAARAPRRINDPGCARTGCRTSRDGM